MKVALDAHGGDYGIAPNIAGTLRAVKDFKCEVVLVGNTEEIKAELAKHNAAAVKGITIEHAPQLIDMHGEPVAECKNKPDSSIVRAAQLVGKGQADAFVSAGNTGAVMVASMLKIKRIKGISRPAIIAPLPNIKGTCVFLDAGANAECKPINFLHFAIMGCVFAETVLGVKNPSVGLLSVGEEEEKGTPLIKASLPVLRQLPNFVGPVEGRDIARATADVVVTDGFTGNIVLKCYESVASTMFSMIKQEVMKRKLAKAGAMLMKPVFKAIAKRTDPDLLGGALLMGVNAPVIIGHGHTSPTAIYNCIRVAIELSASGANGIIKDRIQQYTVKEEEECSKEKQPLSAAEHAE